MIFSIRGGEGWGDTRILAEIIFEIFLILLFRSFFQFYSLGQRFFVPFCSFCSYITYASFVKLLILFIRPFFHIDLFVHLFISFVLVLFIHSIVYFVHLFVLMFCRLLILIVLSIYLYCLCQFCLSVDFVHYLHLSILLATFSFICWFCTYEMHTISPFVHFSFLSVFHFVNFSRLSILLLPVFFNYWFCSFVHFVGFTFCSFGFIRCEVCSSVDSIHSSILTVFHFVQLSILLATFLFICWFCSLYTFFHFVYFF